MDASELDLDARLYKASGTLLDEIKYKLPLLLFNPKKSPPRLRQRVLGNKCEELRLLLDRFQEWPQLLDPHLSAFVQELAYAFTLYITTSKDRYGPTRLQDGANVSPLPRAICRLLYSFGKVRGYKIIVRLLNNEPRYLAPMLSCFEAWNTSAKGMIWEERYIMILWLSHLLLAPFELSDMSVESHERSVAAGLEEFADLPGIARNIVSLGLELLQSPSKEREAAAVLLVRLSLRKDMQAHDLLGRLVNLASKNLLFDHNLLVNSAYKALGFLSLLYGLVNASSSTEVGPRLEELFSTAYSLATAADTQSRSIRDAAPARKWLLKILRVILTHAVAAPSCVSADKVNEMLEESIQYFLDALSDRDTPVRMTAAKVLSVVTFRLEGSMSEEIVAAILEALQENVLLEDGRSRKLIPLTDKVLSEAAGMKRNISAVDPLKWHGLMLTLAHLLFRRSPPLNVLSDILQALLLGLEFEQRSNVGTSIGVGVRDAACFGLWALARKYSTQELNNTQVSTFAPQEQSALQLVATQLSISACFDPSGNIRRGSSAALQELIGRHPDTVIQGISVVQVIDYQAVARLSRAMTEVAPQAACLDDEYHHGILPALTQWRGALAADVNQRRWAADSAGKLLKSTPETQTFAFVQSIVERVVDLRPVNLGTTAAARHGLILALASALNSAKSSHGESTAHWLMANQHLFFPLHQLTGSLEGRLTNDMELVMEAAATLIGVLCRSCSDSTPECMLVSQGWVSSVVEVLERCTIAAARDQVVEAVANAAVELFRILPTGEGIAMIEKLVDLNTQPLPAATSKGRIKTLGYICAYIAQQGSHRELQRSIVSYITTIVEGHYKIEMRVDAMAAFGVILSKVKSHDSIEASTASEVLQIGLTDYTNDQRGDIGSLLRLQSIEAVDDARSNPNVPLLSNQITQACMPVVVKLAAEKLNNIRFRAWKCLQSYWQANAAALPQLTRSFHYPADVSSLAYFQQLLALLTIEDFHAQLVLGVISSATAGTEDICRAASNALTVTMRRFARLDHGSILDTVSAIVLDTLARNASGDDRSVIPLLDFVCYLIDQGLFSFEAVKKPASVDGADFWTVLQRIHGPSSSLPRIDAFLNVYSRLLQMQEYRTRALDRLTRQLLHRWPKIRNSAADLLYVDEPDEVLASHDWSGAVSHNKPVVLEIRKRLGVVGNTQTN